MTMISIQHLGPCVGITFLRMGKLTVQLWKIPPGYEVEEHKHSDIDVRIIYLCGNAIVSKLKDFGWVDCPLSIEKSFKRFRIRPGEIHKVNNNGTQNLWLMTVQKYIGTGNVQTVEQNFERT